MKKIEMAIYIVNTLFGKNLSKDPSVSCDNWKVQDLMKRSKGELRDHFKTAQKCNSIGLNTELLDA